LYIKSKVLGWAFGRIQAIKLIKIMEAGEAISLQHCCNMSERKTGCLRAAWWGTVHVFCTFRRLS
jgi:hypothetical protein